jgi:hypothetical protein
MRRRLLAGSLLAALLVAALFLANCAGRPAPRTALSRTASLPWEIPPADYGTQRLYRVSYAGPEGEGGFKVTLRLASPSRFQLQAVDPLGRSLWSLDVAGGTGLMLNHRSRVFCRLTGSFETVELPFGSFPLAVLPALLLDRVPATPIGPAAAAPAKGQRQLQLADREGREWSATLDRDGVPASWSLRQGGEPMLFWVKRDDGSVLSDRERGVQIKWRQVVAEPLRGEIAPLTLPAGYREDACVAPDLPEGKGEPQPPPAGGPAC